MNKVVIKEMCFSLSILESFKNLATKHKNPDLIEESIDMLLKENMIELITDSDSNKHIVLSNNISKSIKLGPLDSLFVMGATTIPIISESQLNHIQKEFMEEMRQFPEYERNSNSADKTMDGNPITYVLGGFGAFGNPASFHNLTARHLRQDIYKACIGLFRELIDIYNKSHFKDSHYTYNLEALMDRFMFRLKGTSPTSESWHRDVAKDSYLLEDDEIYGGWINLDNESQYLSFIPGSHLNVRLKGLKEGFAKIRKEDIHLFKKYKQLIEIKPGHCVIFPQYILHEVVGKKQSYDMMRLFIGWRITESLESIHTNSYLETVLQKQGSPLLPSGQKPPLYASNHSSFFQKKAFMINPEYNYKANIKEWSSSTFPSNLIKENGIVARYLESLEDNNFPKYPDYTETEKRIYFPHSII